MLRVVVFYGWNDGLNEFQGNQYYLIRAGLLHDVLTLPPFLGKKVYAVGAYEKDLLQDALKSTRGNRAKAARLLDTTERIINYKVRQYAIDVRRFKS